MSRLSRFHPGRGSALAILLPILGLLLLLIVTLLGIVASENRQAVGVLARHQAETFAQVALNEIAAKLDTIPPDKHWAAAPGRIRYWNGSDWNNVIDLHSGNAADTNDPDQQTDLNGPLADGTPFILPVNAEYPGAPVMKLDWRYLLEDGAIVPAPLPPGSKAVARFAYWVDLENARVNINTAGFAMTRPDYHLADTPVDTVLAHYAEEVWGCNPWLTDRVGMTESGPVFPPLNRAAAQRLTPQNLTGHPSAIDLSRLEGISVEESFNTFRYAGSYFLRADALNAISDITHWSPPAGSPDLSVRFFSSPEDWQRIVSRESWLKNKAYITTRGRTPEITPWGLPKIALTLLADDGNALNDLTDTFWRKSLWPDGARHADTYTEDTRRVQIPAQQPMTRSGDPQRDRLGDILAAPSHNQSTISGIMTLLRGVLETPMPGYAASLWEKYDAAPGGGEQTAFELLAFADGALNGQSPGLAFVTPFLDLQDHTLYQRAGSFPSADGTRMLSSAAAPFFCNEFVLQAEPVSYRDVSLVRHGLYESVRALHSGDETSGNYNDYVLVNQKAGNNPKPKAILTGQRTGGVNVLLYLLRDLQSKDECFIRIRLQPELIAAPHYGWRQPSLKSFSERFLIYFTNSSLQWSCDDPLAPGGSLRLDLSDDALGPTFPSAGYSVESTARQICFSVNGVPPESTPSGPGYRLPPLDQFASIIVGPFTPGTVISSLRIRLRITASSAARPGGGRNSFTRYFQSFPGTGENLDPESPGFAGAIDDTLPEFRFSDIDTASPVPRFASIEAIDPRNARTAKEWHPNPDDDHTLGDDNSHYLAAKASSTMDESDFSRPSPLLQAIRGRLRYEALRQVKGGLPGHRIERQNASLILGLPGVGHLSGIPTGIASGTPWETLKFHKTADPVPDWLLWNLFYVPYDRSIANQTDGKLNINAMLHPFGIRRTRPLEALLADRVTAPANPATLAAAIAGGPASPSGSLPSDLFVYQGQICDVPGFADNGNEYERETLPRDLADLITTQCDDFRVFLIVEPLRQTRDGRLLPTTTRRIEATLSRTPDAGPSGYAFSDLDESVPRQFSVHLRGEFLAEGNRAPRNNVYDTAIKSVHRSPLGADRRPDTGDDWIIPQRIDLTRYREVK